jgi:hypothetical protein
MGTPLWGIEPRWVGRQLPAPTTEAKLRSWRKLILPFARRSSSYPLQEAHHEFARIVYQFARSSSYPLRVGSRHERAEHGEVLVRLPPAVPLHSNVGHSLALDLVPHHLRRHPPPLPPRRGLHHGRRWCTRRRCQLTIGQSTIRAHLLPPSLSILHEEGEHRGIPLPSVAGRLERPRRPRQRVGRVPAEMALGLLLGIHHGLQRHSQQRHKDNDTLLCHTHTHANKRKKTRGEMWHGH